MKPFHHTDLYTSLVETGFISNWTICRGRRVLFVIAFRNIYRGLNIKAAKIKTELRNEEISSCDISCIFRRSYAEDADGRVCRGTPPDVDISNIFQASKHQLVYCTVCVNKLSGP